MHSHSDRIRTRHFGLDEVKGLVPSSICDVVAAKKQHAKFFALKSFDEATDAGRDAGVFFGRLIRPFGIEPSRRISGPSAEFISVTRLRSRSAVLLHRFSEPLCAPMNNPIRRQRAEGGRVFLTLVLSHFT